MNIDGIDADLDADLDAELENLCEAEDESQHVLPLKLQIEQIETDFKQYKSEWKSLKLRVH